MMDKIYLNDLTVGTTWTSREHTLTEADIIEFAQQYDPQPFHTDPERAKDSFFGTLVASGWQTACLTMRLMVETIPIATGLIGASGSVKWGRPTYPNDRIHVVAEVVDIKRSTSKPNQGIVTVQIDTINQDGEFAQQFTCNMLAFYRPEADVK